VQPSKPQVLRQLQAVRAAFSIVGIFVFVLTFIVLFVRPTTASTDLSLVLPLPFLAALGVLPLTGPAFLIFTEILGTARILVSYHPVASLRHETSVESQTHMLLFRYIFATLTNRLSLQDTAHGFCNCLLKVGRGGNSSFSLFSGSELVRVPPASSNILEKLGVATAFTLIDDELACEPHTIPQQLLIPSGKGLKLLDICPTYDDESSIESESEHTFARANKKSFEGADENDSDSDSDDTFQHNHHHNHHHAPSGRKRLRLLKSRHRKEPKRDDTVKSDATTKVGESSDTEVQFEDPLWWQHLPSLKCIGLACLLVNENDERAPKKTNSAEPSSTGYSHNAQECKKALSRLVCTERRRSQLTSLAQCIGFSTKENAFGDKGDLSTFTERFRLHVVSTALLHGTFWFARSCDASTLLSPARSSLIQVM
jgi:hypothetical protein